MERKKNQKESLLFLFWQFVSLSLVGWGGPIARIALLHEEFVRRKKWISESHFTKILAVYEILPGPEATELAVFFGFTKQKYLGWLVAGLGFMVPGFLLMLLATWLYATYGLMLAPLQAVLWGIKPAAVALIAIALFHMAKSSVTDWKLFFIAVAAAIAFFFFQINFAFILAAGGVLAWLFFSWQSIHKKAKKAFVFFAGIPVLVANASIPLVFWVFLKAGLLTFGGAYTLVPFIYQEAVQKWGWLTAAQYLDGIAFAELLPAPLSIIATFAGFFAHGFTGAILATIGVFLPAFLFTLVGYNSIEKLAGNKKLQHILSGVTAAIIGLLFSTLVDLTRTSVVDMVTLGIALSALFFFWRKTNIAVVILSAGALGYIVHFFI